MVSIFATIAVKVLTSLGLGIIADRLKAWDNHRLGRAESERDALDEENERLRLAAEARQDARDDLAGQPDGELRDDGFRRD